MLAGAGPSFFQSADTLIRMFRTHVIQDEKGVRRFRVSAIAKHFRRQAANNLESDTPSTRSTTRWCNDAYRNRKDYSTCLHFPKDLPQPASRLSIDMTSGYEVIPSLRNA